MPSDPLPLSPEEIAQWREIWEGDGYLPDAPAVAVGRLLVTVEEARTLARAEVIAQHAELRDAAREYVALHDTMNYPKEAAMYPLRLAAALSRLGERE